MISRAISSRESVSRSPIYPRVYLSVGRASRHWGAAALPVGSARACQVNRLVGIGRWIMPILLILDPPPLASHPFAARRGTHGDGE